MIGGKLTEERAIRVNPYFRMSKEVNSADVGYRFHHQRGQSCSYYSHHKEDADVLFFQVYVNAHIKFPFIRLKIIRTH